ncbi:hypothetical protein [Pontimicrobium sp. MEBiC01747]
MKLYKYTSLFLITLFTITSCSDDNNSDNQGGNGGGEETATNANYYPSTLNDFWKYDVANTNNDTNETTNTTDDISVATETATNFTLEANNNTVANGTMNGLLTTTTLSRTNTKLIINGNLELPPAISDLIEFDINLNNIALYDVDANNGTELSTTTNTVQQDFNGFPVSITYVITTKALGSSASMSLNGETYNDVLKANFKVNLKVVTTVTVAGFPIDIDIIEPQDAISIDNFFAKDIGLVRSEANSGYSISAAAITALEAAGIDLGGIPTSISTTNIQELTDYMVAE